MNKEITTIIFDLGGVVLTNDWRDGNPEKIKNFCDYFKTSEENLLSAWIELFPTFRIGKISEENFWKLFLTKAETKNIDIKKAKALWRKHQKPIENMFDLLEKLKDKYTLAVLSTIPREFLDFKIQKFDLKKYFKIIHGSGHIGITKSSTVAFQKILDALKVKPEKILFIDDDISNIETAKSTEINTITFRNQRQLERELIKRGINIY